MATNSPKKTQRVRPKAYSTCLLYNTKEAQGKLSGLSLANCNPNLKSKVPDVVTQEVEEIAVPVPEPQQLTVSDKMSCNYCDAMFAHRVEQKRHYRSDWHRYNLKLRLKGKDKVSEEQFEDISGNISSLSGSDSDSDVDTDTDNQSRIGSGKKLPGSPRRLLDSGNTSTDSESESGNQSEEIARRLPKVYFRNMDGDLLSIYRCVLCHKRIFRVALCVPCDRYNAQQSLARFKRDLNYTKHWFLERSSWACQGWMRIKYGNHGNSLQKRTVYVTM